MGLGTGIAATAARASQAEQAGPQVILNSLYGMAAAAGHKVLRERGSSMAATSANNLSKLTGIAPVRSALETTRRVPYTPATNVGAQWRYMPEAEEGY